MSHTPGPWVCEGPDAGRDHMSIGPEGGPSVAFSMFGYDDEEDQQRSRDNAHLIAAAPEMLAALEVVERWYGIQTWPGASMVDEVIPLVKAALNKAKGIIVDAAH